jgi:hypothetical protein
VDALTKPAPNKKESYKMYSKELVAIIRKMTENGIVGLQDARHLTDIARIAADEIERLGQEVEQLRTKIKSSSFYSQTKDHKPLWK